MFAGRRFYVRNRLQPFATVCGRPSWQKVAVPIGKVAKHVIFVVCFVRIALARLREVATKCKFRGRCGLLSHVRKLTEVSHDMLVSVLSHVSMHVSGCAVSMEEAAKLYV